VIKKSEGGEGLLQQPKNGEKGALLTNQLLYSKEYKS
jgi:hypothetical protein